MSADDTIVVSVDLERRLDKIETDVASMLELVTGIHGAIREAVDNYEPVAEALASSLELLPMIGGMMSKNFRKVYSEIKGKVK